MTSIPTDVSASRSRVSSTALADSRLIPSARGVFESGSRSIASAMCSELTRRSPRRFASALASRYTWPMSYWWEAHAYQQSNKISPSKRNGLHALGVGDDRIYVDHGPTGTDRDRPGLRLALAACRAGDMLVGIKLDRLARSLPDVRDILDELTKRNVKLSLGGSIHDPTDPVGRLLFNVLAMVAEFEADLIRLRTRIGAAGR
jgi:hypothetical protein